MRRTAILIVLLFVTAAAFAAMPPERLHYQGVLRDTAGDPIDGDHDMVFRLFSAETLGDEILVDRRLTVNAQAVVVGGGLFSVYLGEGEVLDGSGPGTYTSLSDVFGDYPDLWLEIQIGAEALAPRLHVAAAGYALNSGRLEGKPASDFIDNSTTTQFKDGKIVAGRTTGTPDAYGLEAYGATGGAYFADTDSSGWARLAHGDTGIEAYGNDRGGFFSNLTGSGQVYAGWGDVGVYAEGSLKAGHFELLGTSVSADLATGIHGIHARGLVAGLFENYGGASSASLANGTIGISAEGTVAGGVFLDPDGTGYANVAWGHTGITAWGNNAGGEFRDDDDTGYAYVGYGDNGIEAIGYGAGGVFRDGNGSGYVYAGYGNYGMQSYGNTAGAYMKDANGSGYSFVGYGDRGISAFGLNAGVYAYDTNNGTSGFLGYGSSTTAGNGTKNFVQNHPYRDDRVIVYAAPEGNEVATYTRGTARLVGGEARIALDETFAWVTNPDIGLTAHLTPRGEGGVWVAELTTSELVVRATKDTADDLLFDYMVWGLRIGFEEVSVLREKGDIEMPIPSMADEQERHAKHPELRKHVALDRFQTMNVATGRGTQVDLTAATRLRDAVGTFDPAIHQVEPPLAEPPAEPTGHESAIHVSEASSRPPAVERTADPADVASVRERSVEPRHPAVEAVAAGDLLVADETGELVIALGEADAGVIGVAIEDSVSIDGAPFVAFVSTGITTLKVDADLGAIARGDLLTTSPTPGHAMRAHAPIPGTVVAKALEPLEAGQGTIRVAVMLR